MRGILGKKIGMTQIFKDTGELIPATVIEAGPCHILQIKNKTEDGYSALQLGFDSKKEKRVKKPDQGHFKKAGVTPKRLVRELRINEEEAKSFEAGGEIYVDMFNQGDFVDVTGVSIGRGFQGGVKRWHWKGGGGGHGSMFHRAPGSIGGGSSDPSRVFKGHHLPGHMGMEKKTIQNLEVIEVDKENNLLVIKGAVPGHKNSYLLIREAKKKKPVSNKQKSEEAKPEEKEQAKKAK